MVTHVYDGFFVGSCLESAVKSIVVGEFVCSCSCYRSRETVVTILRNDGELECLVVNLCGIINLILPSRWTSMQTMSEIVCGKLILLTGNGHFTFVDAVGISSDGCTEVAWTVDGISILFDVVIAKDNIHHLVLIVGYHQ